MYYQLKCKSHFIHKTHMFMQEAANSRQIRIKAVPHNNLQPSNLDFSVHTVQQCRVAAWQKTHHLWKANHTSHYKRRVYHPSNQVHAKINAYKLREGFIIPRGRGERSRSRSIKRTVWKVLQEERSNVAITWGSGVSVPQRSHRCWTGPVRALPAERSGSHNGGPQPFSHRSNSSPEQEGKQRGRTKEGKKCHISVYLASVSRTANVALTPHWVLWLAQQGNS